MSALCLPATTQTPSIEAFPSSLLAEGGINLFYGNCGLPQLSTRVIAAGLTKKEAVLFLDGCKSFDPEPLIQLANKMTNNPDDWLQFLSVSRARNCSEMEGLVFKTLGSRFASDRPKLVILGDPLESFYDKSVPFKTAKALLGLMIRSLQLLSPGCTLAVLSPTSRGDFGRRRLLSAYLKTCAHRIFETTLEDEAAKIQLTEERPGTKQWDILL